MFAMGKNRSAKVLVRRSPDTTAGDKVSQEQVETGGSAELELISTQMLKQILSSSDDEGRAAIEEAARTEVEGVLARYTETGYFEIIDNDELQAILNSNDDLPTLTRPSDPTLEPLHDYVATENLSLVSTQALRQVFGVDEKVDEDDPDGEVNVRDFDPYDCY